MKKSFKQKKGMFDIDENGEIVKNRLVPPLKLCSSPKALENGHECNSLTNRLRRRNLLHKSLEFNLSSSTILTPRVIRADHNIVPISTPSASTYRKINFGSTIILNNRKIAKNLLLDSLPL